MSSEKKLRAKYNVSAKLFVETWQAAAHVEEVSQKLGMPVPIVHARATGYRRKGLILKPMPRKNPNAVDVDELNRIILEMEAKAGGGAAPAGPDQDLQKAIEEVLGRVS